MILLIDFGNPKVHVIIVNKLETKFDWFTLEEDITLSNICYNKCINLVISLTFPAMVSLQNKLSSIEDSD